jgi:dTDP-4-dehydrorhamnose reductase
VAGNLTVSPTYVPHLVHTVMDLLIDEEKGTWHLANHGSVSWFDFAQQIAHSLKLDTSWIQSVDANELGFIARRPVNSVLSSERGQLLPSLEKGIEEYIKAGFRLKRKVA